MALDKRWKTRNKRMEIKTMKSCSKLINQEFFVGLELNREELSKFYNSIYRVVHGSAPEIIEKYALQDKEILISVLVELDKALETKVALETMGVKKID